MYWLAFAGVAWIWNKETWYPRPAMPRAVGWEWSKGKASVALVAGLALGWAGFNTSTILTDAGIEIVYPHEFAANSVAAHPQAGVRALRAMSQRMTTPTRSPQELLAELRDRYGMDEVAAILVPELSRLSQ